MANTYLVLTDFHLDWSLTEVSTNNHRKVSLTGDFSNNFLYIIVQTSKNINYKVQIIKFTCYLGEQIKKIPSKMFYIVILKSSANLGKCLH